MVVVIHRWDRGLRGYDYDIPNNLRISSFESRGRVSTHDLMVGSVLKVKAGRDGA